jgi:hypothetical protein
MNVRVNTRAHRDDPRAAALEQELRAILDEALPRAETVVAAVRERLGG